MIHPSATQILQTIEATLVDVVEPAVDSAVARSALATIRHLLRHVVLRIESEPAALANDVARLDLLLASLRDYLQGAGDHVQADALSARADCDLPAAMAIAPLAARAAQLRQALQDVLLFLQSQRDVRRGDAAYEAARAQIRTYLGEQITDEAALIEPAFAGQGPRR